MNRCYGGPALDRFNPLCPYPETRHRGRGSPEQAASFRCVAPRPVE